MERNEIIGKTFKRRVIILSYRSGAENIFFVVFIKSYITFGVWCFGRVAKCCYDYSEQDKKYYG